MQPAQLVLDPPSASPRLAWGSLPPRENQLQGLLPTLALEAGEQPRPGIVTADENAFCLPWGFPAVSAHMSRLEFRATRRGHVAHSVQGSGVGLQFDTKPIETYSIL